MKKLDKAFENILDVALRRHLETKGKNVVVGTEFFE